MTGIRGISSMATRQLLADLSAMYAAHSGVTASFESVGGVDAARRVMGDEPFDIVVLAADAIGKLQQARKIVEGSRVDIVRSAVAVAVRAGAPRPDIATEAALRRAVLAAEGIGYSTGPSGTALLQLFDRWGLSARVRERLVQAPPGVPVASLVADGKVAIGFQQLSELMHVEGIAIVGPMPEGTEMVTVFSGAVCTASAQPGAGRELLTFMASPATAQAKQRQGMEPA